MAVHPRALYQRSVTRAVCALALAVFAVAQKGAAQSDSDRRTAGVIRQLRESSNAAIARHDTAGSYFAKWQEVEGRWRVQSATYMPERCSGSAYCARMP